MRAPIHALIARATMAHLAYTSVFERVNQTATGTTAAYGALTAVAGAAGSVTIHLHSTAADSLKMCFDAGIVNSDGAHTVVIDTTDGKTINGGSTVTLPAVAGAFAWCFYDTGIGEWVAILNTNASPTFTPPPTYTTTAPTLQYTVTTTPTAIPQAAITTAAFTAQQKAIVTWSVTAQTDAGFQDNAIYRMFDGVVGTTIDAFEQTVGNSAVDNLAAFNANSWTLEVVGNGSPRTFGLGVSVATGGHTVIPSLAVRGVVQIVDG